MAFHKFLLIIRSLLKGFNFIYKRKCHEDSENKVVTILHNNSDYIYLSANIFKVKKIHENNWTSVGAYCL